MNLVSQLAGRLRVERPVRVRISSLTEGPSVIGWLRPIVLLPAIRPDVALIHAPMADRAGNVWIGRQRELATMAHAAAKTIVTVEKIHDGDLLADPVLAAGTLPGFYVEGVALAPNGCWPLGLPDHYPADLAHLAEYARLAASAEGFARYLEQYVYARKAA